MQVPSGSWKCVFDGCSRTRSLKLLLGITYQERPRFFYTCRGYSSVVHGLRLATEQDPAQLKGASQCWSGVGKLPSPWGAA